MVVERQTSFSGGMVDTAADGRLPADSYLFAQNLDLVGGRLVSRPRLVDVRARPLGMETIRNIGRRAPRGARELKPGFLDVPAPARRSRPMRGA